MADEVFWDTSGFFALLNTDDPQHGDAVGLAHLLAVEPRGSVTTDAVVGECCTLLVARRKPHLVTTFLDFSEQSSALEVVHLDVALVAATKEFLRKHLDHEYSFVDCASFVVMARRGLREARRLTNISRRPGSSSSSARLGDGGDAHPPMALISIFGSRGGLAA